MEKLITEFRVIETDDGFRLEIKGDKDKIRPYVECHDFIRGRFGRHRPYSGFGCGPWSVGSKMWETMANCWEKEGEKTEK